MAKYDEDLHENEFFRTFQDKFPSHFDLVASNCYMACIPRADVAFHMKINQTDIENHILIKEQQSDSAEESSGTEFTSLNSKHAIIKGEYIYTKLGFKELKKIKILFSEEFYNANDQSYQLLCIEQPLEGGGSDDNSFSLTVSMETVEDCCRFLWNDSATNEKVRKMIDTMCSTVRVTTNELYPKAIHDKALGIYRSALEEAGSKLTHWKRTNSLSAKSFFQLAIESYVLDKLHPQVFKSLCRIDIGDKQMNKITRQFSEATYRDLGINEEFKDNLMVANKFLVLLNAAKCPLEKLSCFKKTMIALTKGLRNSSTVVTADDILPMLVYLVLKAEIPNWKCNLLYIKEFHFSQVSNEELQYYLTSFEAAVEYITSGDLQKNLGPSFHHPKLPDTTGMDEIEKANVVVLERLLKSVYEGDLELVKKVVTEIKKLPDELSQQLCHPLCGCKKCTSIVENYNNHPSRVSLFSKDTRLRNSLHYAVIAGHYNVLEWLLENSELKEDVNEEDINQATLLHLSALRGNQKCLLYLLYKGAMVNKTDKLGNTPLHVACSHGHLECVKGLVFHRKKCNLLTKNSQGDTALHLAARWGYVSIASSLLEVGADPMAKNTIGETPLTATYDLRVYLHLKTYLNDPESSHTKPPPLIKPEDSIPTSSITSSVRHYSSTSDINTESSVGGATATGSRLPQKNKRRSSIANFKIETDRQVKKLFRAINDNDFAMVKYLLGWKDDGDKINHHKEPVEEPDLGQNSISSSTDQPLCHPLCQCEKCLHLRKGRPLPLVTVNSCDAKGNTPLHKASLHGRRQIVQTLLSHGATINAANKDELLTPLHLACQYNHRDIVMILLENHVQFNSCDKKGNTPLHFCCNNGHMDSAILLMIHGADLTVANDRGDTPLHNAARWNHASLVKELMLYGAMYSVTNKNNKTAIDLTTDDEVYDIIQQAIKGEIPTGEYACQKYAEDPGISDEEEFEHL